MKRETINQLVVFALLVFAGVALRLYFQYLPNFAPVAALALFAGYYFRSSALALATPLLVMLISDQLIGGYEGPVMLAVYGMLALPVAMRSLLRRRVNLVPENWRDGLGSAATLLGCSLFASIAFFVVTNLMTWWATELYANTLPELVRCYVQALPFFRYTLTGDLAFGAVLFGGYAVCLRAAGESVLVSSGEAA